jgi:hypothetical protein
VRKEYACWWSPFKLRNARDAGIFAQMWGRILSAPLYVGDAIAICMDKAR